MMYNKLFIIIIMPVAVAILATILTLSTFTIPIFAQTAEGVNQTMQDMGQSANQTGEGMQQGANQTGEAIQGNASDIGSKVTEGAKDVIGGIGEKLQDLAK
ncbi:MAG TPA: hypothetical protein VFT83_03770 [Nitrososphaeraceae archaeon]|nr:hypothetical protein [Nitrososphaeraceae archaeon]